jgi:hypothetical protein
MKVFTVYRPNVPTDTHNEDQRNSPNEPQFEGVVFSDGRVAIRWLTAKRSTSVWDSIYDAFDIHGHAEYGTWVRWGDGSEQKYVGFGVFLDKIDD